MRRVAAFTRILYIGGTQIFVRALDQLEPTPIGGVGQPRHLFVSPDGQWIGYVDFMIKQGDGSDQTAAPPTIVVVQN